MKRRYKTYFKLNLMSLFFIAISFISVTLAWFAYTGISRATLDVPVKAWYIELEKDGNKISNDIIISLSEIYPGMDIVDELVKIKNLGDSDAGLSYKIISVDVLGNKDYSYNVEQSLVTSDYVEDLLSNELPFSINMNLSKNYVASKGDESFFEVSISWPLDSDHDELDSEWGTKAYNFQVEEERKKQIDTNYEIKPSIQVVISVTAEQYLGDNSSSDMDYNLGDEILFNVVNNQKCGTISSTCIKTYVIDENNVLGDNIVTLLPNPYNTYLSGTYDQYDSLLSSITNTWTANTRPLLVEDLMKIISKDVKDSLLIRNNLSDSIIGSLKYNDRMNTEVNKVINYDGYYKFSNNRFGFLSSSECYWTKSEFNYDKSFALRKIDEDSSKIYGNEKNLSCKVIPVILAAKSDLE